MTDLRTEDGFPYISAQELARRKLSDADDGEFGNLWFIAAIEIVVLIGLTVWVFWRFGA